ncbi:hypothetical protein K492DRAFT_182226 [Lichtheimia hyalospora FSU 10163]|nr:hypothetical protein K492DRAFT_182226 [Lichtheimia hyalospora FSU 10163]
MLPRIALFSSAVLVLLLANTSNAAPAFQKRDFGDVDEVWDGDDLTSLGDFGSGGFNAADIDDIEDVIDDDDDFGLGDLAKRDGDDLIHGGGGVNLPGSELAKRDGDDLIHAGGGVNLPESDLV